MGTANVSVSFDAETAEEAAGLIARWTLHEGCRVSSSFIEANPPQITDSDGSVVEAPAPEVVEVTDGEPS